MPHYIIQKDGVYNLYSTIVDYCCLENGLSLDEFKEYYRNEYGEHVMAQLPDRLARADETGCSAKYATLEGTIETFIFYHPKFNRKQFIDKFLTLKK